MSEMHLPNAAHHAGTPEVHHETSDVNVRAVFGFGIGLTIVSVIIGAGVWVLFQYFNTREARPVFTEYPLAVDLPSLPPEPRLQTNPHQDMSDLRARENEILTSYGWVDKTTGRVRIPIERAMQLTVERGLPSRPAGEQTR